jgi:hypothetical protein
MFCSNCGNQIDSNSNVCSYCETGVANNSNPVQVNNNSNNYNSDVPTFSPTHSIILLIFSVLCCGGVIGAVFAILSLTEGNKVNEYVRNGNIEEAKIAKKNSDKWIKATYITCAIAAAITIIIGIFYLIMGLASI